jgi:lysophospholipase L1-like esterase
MIRTKRSGEPGKSKTHQSRSKRVRALRFSVWLIAVLVMFELGIRFAGYMLRRDGVATPAANGVIYCVGDSFTYGQGVRTEEAWPQLLGQRLREKLGASAPTVRTLAQPGRSSSAAMVDVANILKRGDASLVLIMTGWNANDGDFAAYAADKQRAVPLGAKVDLALEHSALYRLVKYAVTYRQRTLLLDNVKIVPQTNSMALYDFRSYQEIAEKNLGQIARMCKASGVSCIFLTYPHRLLPPNPYSQTEYYHVVFGRTALTEQDYFVHDRRPDEIAIDAVIRKVAEREGIPLVDLHPALATSIPDQVFQADWHHPTVLGHEFMARTVFETLPLDGATSGVERDP